jgi:hypothetical protein
MTDDTKLTPDRVYLTVVGVGTIPGGCLVDEPLSNGSRPILDEDFDDPGQRVPRSGTWAIRFPFELSDWPELDPVLAHKILGYGYQFCAEERDEWDVVGVDMDSDLYAVARDHEYESCLSEPNTSWAIPCTIPESMATVQPERRGGSDAYPYRTDYPVAEFDDVPNEVAPTRSCRLVGWDGNKYCDVIVLDNRRSDYSDGLERVVRTSIKAGYIYEPIDPTRFPGR